MDNALVFLITGFWMLMIFDCIRHDPEKRTWFWIVMSPYLGGILYFLVRRLPYLAFTLPTPLKRWSYRKKIWDAEAAAKNIGKPYQFINLGNVLLDAGLTERSLEAYEQALKQDPDSINALWGIADISRSQKHYDKAKTYLEPIIEKDPDHKFGEASLAYGEALYHLQEWSLVKEHLIEDVRRWSHPEAVIMLATIQIQDGEIEAAKDGLEKMMFNLKGTPRFYFRKKRHLLGAAQRLLRQLK